MSDGFQIRLNVRIEVERNYHNIHNFFIQKELLLNLKIMIIMKISFKIIAVR